MRSWSVTVLAVASMLVLAAPPARAQEEREPPYSTHKAELGYTLTSGNARAQSLSALYGFRRVLESAEFRLDAAAIRNETRDRVFVGVDLFNRPVFVAKDNVAAEAYAVDAKARRDLGDRLFAYGLGGWARIVQSGLEDRWRAGGGVGIKLIRPEPHHLDLELGAEYNRERYVDGGEADFPSARAFADYDLRLSSHASFSSDLEYLQNVDDTKDYRVNWASSITAAISSHVALKATYLLLFDNQPAVLVIVPGPPIVTDEREDLDQIVTTSLVVNW